MCVSCMSAVEAPAETRENFTRKPNKKGTGLARTGTNTGEKRSTCLPVYVAWRLCPVRAAPRAPEFKERRNPLTRNCPTTLAQGDSFA